MDYYVDKIRILASRYLMVLSVRRLDMLLTWRPFQQGYLNSYRFRGTRNVKTVTKPLESGPDQ